MALSELSWSGRRRRSHRTPLLNTNSLSMVPVDRGEESTRLERQLIHHNRAKSCALERAEEVKSHLDPQFPIFVKSIIASNIGVGSSMYTPPNFCNFLPKENAMISLIDENEQVYTVKFFGEKDRRISAGWAYFSKEHRLVNGDALVFHLVKPAALKVYIIRAYGMADIGGISDHVLTRKKQTESWTRAKRISEVAAAKAPHNLPSAFLLQSRGVAGINNKVTLERDEGYTSDSRERVFVDHDKAKSCAMERAEKVKAHLDPTFPSFVKSMKPSYISGCFVLYLPIHFYRSNLPKENVIICLVDENQEEYPVNYTVGGWFGAGWRSFCVAHQLVEGDALVFQLVKPTQFQVYIIRAFSVAEIGGTSGLLNLGAQDKQAESCKRIRRMSEKTTTVFPDTQLQGVLQQPKEETTSNNDEAGLEDVEGTKFLETSDFEEIKDLESFIVVVNGSLIDSLLSKEEHSKYYQLCCTQKHRLHNGIPERIDSKLAAGIISQTVEVADSIRAAKLSTPKEELAVWNKKLDVLELLGMDVGFLRARVEELSSLLESKEVMYSKRIRKVLAHRDEILEKKKALKHKLTELEGTCRWYETEMETLQVKVGDYEVMFQAVVDAPW